MPLAKGTVLGSCEILDLLGKGGMGEVYRGRDTKLGREVAIKTLPYGFALDTDRLDRFDREAQVLAALNHPNIAAIYSLEEMSGSKYLVLELVDGETLEERLDRGPMELTDTLNTALQIAEALAAAHDKGIIHRDLKPANIKITPAGKVKVLDFGLAKVLEATPSNVAAADSPTVSGIQTAAGVILGTAAYMSPEQARGKVVDKRADIWAFGCIAYQMITGQMTFPNRETVSDTLVGILAREPDWSLLPAATPPALRTLLRRCLDKDPSRRLQDIGDARIELEDIRREAVPTDSVRARAPWGRRDYALAALAALFLTTSVILGIFRLTPRSEQPMPVRFEVQTSMGTGFRAWANPISAAKSPWPELSPDGRKLVFTATTETKQLLWMRRLDSAAAQPLADTDEAILPFWSPDGEHIGFVSQDKVKRIPVFGGAAQVICNSTIDLNNGAAWGLEGVILMGQLSGPLKRVTASGGIPEPATELDQSRREISHRLPRFLPDGRHFTYVATSERGGPQGFVGKVGSKERKELPGVASESIYSDGHLLFVSDGSLMGQSFDVDRLELSGEPILVAAQISSSPNSGAFSASLTGALAYRPTGYLRYSGPAELVWFDRTGKRLGLAGAEGEYGNIDLSPDGRHVVFDRGSPSDIWVLDISKGLVSRVTADPAEDGFPVWSPDGKVFAFMTTRDGGIANIYRRAFGVIARDEAMVKGEGFKSPSGWTGDGRYFVYVGMGQGGSFDIWVKPLTEEQAPRPLMETPFNEAFTAVSPDSRWLAYGSNETGRYEIYIQSFPDLGARQQISTGGGIMAKWSADGRELYYVAPDSRLMAVSIKPTGSALEVGSPVALFGVRIVGGGHYIGGQARNYDVGADGRFLVKVATADETAAPISVILNWRSLLMK